MKTIKVLALAASASLLVASCSRTAGARYVDLSTGKEVELVKDDQTGLWVAADTRKPVYMYVDTKSNDTIYGSNGKVINGHVVRLDDGTYKYDADYEVRTRPTVVSGDYKVKVEKDGDIKIKTDDKKIKIDEDGKKTKKD